jgi:hypothetical protein
MMVKQSTNINEQLTEHKNEHDIWGTLRRGLQQGHKYGGVDQVNEIDPVKILSMFMLF